MSDTLKPALYPRYCFHLSPTANAWCFFQTSELFELDEKDGFNGAEFLLEKYSSYILLTILLGEGLYFFRNLPIKWVRIVGVVVAIDEFNGFRAYTIDDSSGVCIEAMISLSAPTGDLTSNAAPTGRLAQPATPYDHIDVGSVVDVKGALTTFREIRQMKVEKMTCLRGTAAEMKLWGKRAAFRRDVLEKPWVVQEKILRKCRKEAERSEAEAERKKTKVKASTAGKSGSLRKVTRHQRSQDREDNTARRSKSAAEKEAISRILASTKGEYNALGL